MRNCIFGVRASEGCHQSQHQVTRLSGAYNSGLMLYKTKALQQPPQPAHISLGQSRESWCHVSLSYMLCIAIHLLPTGAKTIPADQHAGQSTHR